MRVRARVTILLALLLAVLIAAQWTIQQRLMLPRFELNALAGSIAAHSGGLGHGLRSELRLPI